MISGHGSQACRAIIEPLPMLAYGTPAHSGAKRLNSQGYFGLLPFEHHTVCQGLPSPSRT